MLQIFFAMFLFLPFLSVSDLHRLVVFILNLRTRVVNIFINCFPVDFPSCLWKKKLNFFVLRVGTYVLSDSQTMMLLENFDNQVHVISQFFGLSFKTCPSMFFNFILPFDHVFGFT